MAGAATLQVSNPAILLWKGHPWVRVGLCWKEGAAPSDVPREDAPSADECGSQRRQDPLPTHGRMVPAPKLSPRSCKGLGTLRGEDAPAAPHCSWVLHPQHHPHPTHLLPPCCPQPKPFLPLFIFLSFIRKAGGTGRV